MLVFIFVAGVVSGAVELVACGAAGLGLGLVFELLARRQQRRSRRVARRWTYIAAQGLASNEVTTVDSRPEPGQ